MTSDFKVPGPVRPPCGVLGGHFYDRDGACLYGCPDSPLGVSAPSPAAGTPNRAAGVPMRSAQSSPRGAAPPAASSRT